jgi:Tol biopolymer transport system component
MKTKMIITFSLIEIITITLVAQNNSIDYFGQIQPDDSAVIFAPGIISLADRLEGNITFSPDGCECFFTVHGLNYSTYKIYYTKRKNNTWSPQMEAPFFVGQKNSNPFFSRDGEKLYFDSQINRSENNTRDIWMVQHTKGRWSDPKILPSPINSDYYDAYYSETSDSTGYFTSNRPDGEGYDIWCTLGQPIQAKNLGVTVNSKSFEYCPCVSPDGSFLIFVSLRSGGPDLYVTFNDGNGGWTAPVNIKKINTSAEEADPSLSPDGRFLFFTRGHGGMEPQDIYWVSTKVIDDIKKEVFNSKITK